MNRIPTYIRKHKVKSALLFTFTVMAVLYWFSLPRDLFKGIPCSTVVTDRNGELLGARIADDGQWRFPPSGTVPPRFAEALIMFEDKAFRYHPGVNPASLARAAWQNLRSHSIVSGGSTITMQTIRLSRDRKKRNLWQKGIEAILATRLEIRYSKDEILALYAAHAPFGGNVVGLEAASWRYFGRPPGELSWAESATLAVLPNAPAAIHPGKNRDALKAKRDRLLRRLYEKGRIDSLTFALACDEPLPSAPLPLPQYAPHLTEWYCRNAKGRETRTAIDLSLQKRVEQTVGRWHGEFMRSGIDAIAAIVFDVHTMEAVAYCGNAGYGSGRPGCEVDAARSPRSTGSILKPFLYCALLQEGEILPKTLLPDIPVNINGFSPQNFDRKFYGAVPADEALARSLNVPAVHSLRKYGPAKFHSLLRDAGMTTLTRPASDYGLSLILGGAEGTLYEIAAIYAKMASMLEPANQMPLETAASTSASDKTSPKISSEVSGAANGSSNRTHHRLPKDSKGCKSDSGSGMKTTLESKPFPLNDRMAIYCTFEALKEVNRPDEMDWRMISSVRKVAWKTGTSYGFRDAWAVGVTPDYVVGVWVGNAQGQGSPGLVGARTAGPVMFDIFNLLPSSGWFEMPGYGEYATAEVCRQSGHLKSRHCEECDTVMLPKAAMRSAPCPYHFPAGEQSPAEAESQGTRVTKDKTIDSSEDATSVQSIFILPPAMEWYYKMHHPEYRSASMQRRHSALAGKGPMEFIYPESGSTIMLPRQLDGSEGNAVFHIAHSNPDATVFWHIDGHYSGSTRFIHQLSLHPSSGHHTCTAVDDAGNSVSVGFEVE
ncbi:MAG: penicillin-binding protein 1C [Clostridium sp.]|nr:penicillin-binding protein 1C [Clostridium sp.]